MYHFYVYIYNVVGGGRKSSMCPPLENVFGGGLYMLVRGIIREGGKKFL